MTIDAAQDVAVVVCARNEEARIAATLDALRRVLPDATLIVADDHSTDATAQLAREHGASVVAAERRLGKGGAATLGSRRALELCGPDGRYLLCDGDLAASAERLPALLSALAGADLVVGAFERRIGGGFGVALGFAGWAVRRRTGLLLAAPISGQRALSGECLQAVLPFAPRFGMEIGMTIDAARSGMRVAEVPLALEHRATGRTLRGFAHRLLQLRDFAAVYVARR